VYRGMRLEVYIGTRRDLRGLWCADPAARVWFSEICVEKAPTYHVTEAVTGPKELGGTGAGLNWASEGDSIQTNTYVRRLWRQKAPNYPPHATLSWSDTKSTFSEITHSGSTRPCHCCT